MSSNYNVMRHGELDDVAGLLSMPYIEDWFGQGHTVALLINLAERIGRLEKLHQHPVTHTEENPPGIRS